MSEIISSNFISHFQKKGIENLYIFYGPETYFHDQYISLLARKIFTDPSAKDFNNHIFYGGESTVADILSTCLSYPMLSDFKMVTVKQFDKLSIDNKDSLLNYFNNPQKSTVLVLSAESWGKSSLHKQLMNSSVSVNCRTLYDREVYAWVKSKFQDKNLEADSAAISFLIENTGYNLLRLNVEIEKIIDFLPAGKKISQEIVSDITGFSREINIFNLQKELGAQNLKNSLKLCLKLLEQGESLAFILPMIFLFFKRMWIVKELVDKGFGQQQILSKIGGSSYYYRDIFSSIKNFSSDQLISIFEKLEFADIQLKTSQKTEESILTMIAYYICKI